MSEKYAHNRVMSSKCVHNRVMSAKYAYNRVTSSICVHNRVASAKCAHNRVILASYVHNVVTTFASKTYTPGDRFSGSCAGHKVAVVHTTGHRKVPSCDKGCFYEAESNTYIMTLNAHGECRKKSHTFPYSQICTV